MRRLFGRRQPSIYEHIRANLAEVGVSEQGRELPDEDELTEELGFGWVPGAVEGAITRHTEASGPGADEEVAEMAAALRELADRRTKESRERVRRGFELGSTRTQLDGVLEQLRADPPRDQRALHEEARTIARTSGAREEVKLALGILGEFGQEDDVELFRTFARHEEFTLYAAIALGKTVEDPIGEWLELARHVDGWGRIELVDLMAGAPPREDACAYLLREGFRNSVMYGYTAELVAEHCDLAGALSGKPDDELLAGARDILSTLADEAWGGGPNGGMMDYERGLLATERFLTALEPRRLDDYLAVSSLRSFLEDDLGWAEDAEVRERVEARRTTLGWSPEACRQLAQRCREILELPHWRELVESELERDHEELPWPALEVARRLELPARDFIARHLERHPEETGAWFALAAGTSEEQLQDLLTLAGRLYGFEELGAGPGEELFRPGIFLIADGLLQELARHPGQGWELVGPALRSPVIRNRHFALRALSSWPPELLGDEQRQALEQVARDDPDDEVREGAGRLLRGEPLEMA